MICMGVNIFSIDELKGGLPCDPPRGFGGSGGVFGLWRGPGGSDFDDQGLKRKLNHCRM